jgi:hypothetical protein
VEKSIKDGAAVIYDVNLGHEMSIKYERLPSFQISADFKLEMCQDITGGETVMIIVKIKGE